MPFSTRPQDTGGPMSLRSDEQMLGIILARRLSSALEGFLYFRSSFVEKTGRDVNFTYTCRAFATRRRRNR